MNIPIKHSSFPNDLGEKCGLFLDFDDNYGGIIDKSGRNQVITETPTIKKAVGVQGQCIDVRDDNLHAIATVSDNADIRLSSNFTFMCWVNLESFSGSSDSRGLVWKGSDWGIRFEPSNSRIRLYLYDSVGLKNGVLMSSFQLNSWHHVGFTVDGSTYTLYVDGIAVSSLDNLASPTNTTNNLIIGYQDVSRDMDGYIDRVFIYQRTLTKLEINNEYKSFTPSSKGKEYPYSLDADCQLALLFDDNYNDSSVYDRTIVASNTDRPLIPGVNFTLSRFNGTSDNYTLGFNSTLSAFSASFWVRAVAVDGFREVIGQPGGDRIIIQNGTGKIYFQSSSYTLSTTALTVGQLHHVVVCVDGLDVTFYLDGNPNGSGTLGTARVVNSNTWKVSPNNILEGDIGRIFIFSKILSASEVKSEYLEHRS